MSTIRGSFSITYLWVRIAKTYTSIKVRSKEYMRNGSSGKDKKTYEETILSPVPAIALIARN